MKQRLPAHHHQSDGPTAADTEEDRMQVKPPDTREAAVADENHDANIGRWTTWTERDETLATRIPLGAPACLAELQRDRVR